jgi:hypothetical protein
VLRGFRFGKLGYDLVEKRGLHAIKPAPICPLRISSCHGRDTSRQDESSCVGHSTPRTGPVTLLLPHIAATNLNTNLLATGDPLAEVQRQAETGLEFASNIQFGIVIDVITAQLALIRTLRGLKSKFGSFDDEHFNELRFERHFSGNPVLALPECWYWIRKLQARFFAGDYSVGNRRIITCWTAHLDISLVFGDG